MSKPSPPQAPDPTATINAQTAINKETALTNASLNRVNQNTPYGSSTYTTNGTDANGVPEYTQNVTLSPEQQNLYNMTTQGQQVLGDTALGQLDNLRSSYSTPFSFGGPNVSGSLPSAGQIQTAIGNSGQIQTGFGGYGQAQTGIDTSGLPGITGQVGTGDYSKQVKDAQDAAYNSQTQYLDPQFSQQGQELDAKLANQGLQVGDRAYDNSQDQFGRTKQAAYQSARDAATAAGNQEQNTLYGQALSSAGFQNSANQQGYNQLQSNAALYNAGQGQNYNQSLGAADFANSAQNQQYGQNLGTAGFTNSAQNQQYGQNLSGANLNNSASAQALSQALALYNQPLNSYNALATGAQVTNPNFSSVPTANQANTDVAGITNQGYQNQLSRYQQQQQGVNNLFSLGGSLGSAAILASDRRVKKAIQRVGKLASGIPTYVFRYVWQEDNEPLNYGVMAQDVIHIPGAVHVMDGGFFGVNYAVIA